MRCGGPPLKPKLHFEYGDSVQAESAAQRSGHIETCPQVIKLRALAQVCPAREHALLSAKVIADQHDEAGHGAEQ